MNELYSQDLRSKSTGNFVKLKSHVKTPKKNLKHIMNHNLNWFDEKERKINLRNNNSNEKKQLELLPIAGYTPKNIMLINS